MRMVKYLLLLVAFAICDTDYIVCSTGTRDYDNETLFEAAQGNLSGRGYVTSNGCSETYTVGNIIVDGQTNESATDRLVFRSQVPLGRTITLTASSDGFGVVSGYTIVTGLRFTSATATGVPLYIKTTAESYITIDACHINGNADSYGIGVQGGTNAIIKNCAIILTNATGSYPAFHIYNPGAGLSTTLYNTTIIKSNGTGIGALNNGTSLVITNCAIKAPVCLSSTNSPTYTKSKVYTSDATGTNGSITAPQFNFDADGYSLLTGSVLINAGVDIAGFTNSINGVTRKSGSWDVGAYELSSGSVRRCGPLGRSGGAPLGSGR